MGNKMTRQRSGPGDGTDPATGQRAESAVGFNLTTRSARKDVRMKGREKACEVARWPRWPAKAREGVRKGPIITQLLAVGIGDGLRRRAKKARVGPAPPLAVAIRRDSDPVHLRIYVIKPIEWQQSKIDSCHSIDWTSYNPTIRGHVARRMARAGGRAGPVWGLAWPGRGFSCVRAAAPPSAPAVTTPP